MLAQFSSSGAVPGLMYWNAQTSTWVNLPAKLQSQAITVTLPSSWITAQTLTSFTFAVSGAL